MDIQMRIMQVLIIIALFSSFTFSQNAENNLVLSGNLKTDAKIVSDNFVETNTPQFSYFVENKKSPILAGVLSFLIPGAGEVYTEEYLKAGIFLAIEAAVITTAVVYDGKGDVDIF